MPTGSARSRPTCFGRPATIVGTNHADRISGTRGRDVIIAGNGNDLVVGDNANPVGDEAGPTASDDLAGAGGRRPAAGFMVGDNYASGDASGAHHDKNQRAGGGPDTVVVGRRLSTS